jgi:hypothetical protein
LSRFCPAVPHKFGKMRLPYFDDLTILRGMYDMCDTVIRMVFIVNQLDEEDVIDVSPECRK